MKVHDLQIDSMVSISRETYNSLLQDSKFLAALNSVGVDSWEGYEEAMHLIEEEGLHF